MFCGETELPQTFISETSYVKIIFFAENYTDQVTMKWIQFNYYFELFIKGKHQDRISFCKWLFTNNKLLFLWYFFSDIFRVWFTSWATNGGVFAIWTASRIVSESSWWSGSRVSDLRKKTIIWLSISAVAHIEIQIHEPLIWLTSISLIPNYRITKSWPHCIV